MSKLREGKYTFLDIPDTPYLDDLSLTASLILSTWSQLLMTSSVLLETQLKTAGRLGQIKSAQSRGLPDSLLCPTPLASLENI